MPLFSAVIIARNEAHNIARCLAPLLRATDDVLVLDSGSSDGTPELCRNLGARVVETDWKGYAANKNQANELAKYPWILSIDADEVVSEELLQSLLTLQPESNAAYALDRFTNYCGTWVKHSGWYPDWKVRLFDKRQCRWEGAFVHETLYLPPGTQIHRLQGKLYHYSYQNSDDHWERIERYAELSARQMLAEGKRPSIFKQLLSPVARFFRTLVLKKGFLDGALGWKLSWRNAWLAHRKQQLLAQYYRTPPKS
jgi:glycosyltransferase involved in cell wall biosynthesis